MILGIACTVYQFTTQYVSSDFWSLNGFIGTGIWSGVYLIVMSFLQVQSSFKIRIPGHLLSIFLSAVGVLDLVAVIAFSIFSAFATNHPCTLKEYQKIEMCQERSGLLVR